MTRRDCAAENLQIGRSHVFLTAQPWVKPAHDESRKWLLVLQLDHPQPCRVRNGVGAAGGVELVEERADMEFGGVNGNP
jgi:hypothetical protein